MQLSIHMFNYHIVDMVLFKTLVATIITGKPSNSEFLWVYNLMLYEWRTNSPTPRKGHGQSGKSLIYCDNVHTNLNFPSPIPTTFAFR